MPTSSIEAESSSETDEEILSRWKNGDTSAGELFFQRHFPWLYSFLDSKVDEGVDGLVRTAFRRLYEIYNDERQTPAVRPVTALAKIAFDQLKKHYRENLKTYRGRSEPSFQQLGSYPSTIIDVDEKLQGIWDSAITSLPWTKQVVLELGAAKGLGFSATEIAYVMSLGPEHIQMTIKEGHTLLTRRFETSGVDKSRLIFLGKYHFDHAGESCT